MIGTHPIWNKRFWRNAAIALLVNTLYYIWTRKLDLLPTSLALLVAAGAQRPMLFFYGQVVFGALYSLWRYPPVDFAGYGRVLVGAGLHLLFLWWWLKHWPTSWWAITGRILLFILVAVIVIPGVVLLLFDVCWPCVMPALPTVPPLGSPVSLR